MAIIYLTRFPERPAPSSNTFRFRGKARCRSSARLKVAMDGAGCDYYPRGSSRIRGKSGQATLPSALSCTTWGFSCGSACANARWALTPPFHPYPALSVLGGIFSVTLSVTRDLHSRRPRFHGACCLAVFGLSSGKTGVKPAITRHDDENNTERVRVPVSVGLAFRRVKF